MARMKLLSILGIRTHPPIGELRAIFDNSATAEEKHTAAAACLDRYLSSDESTALRRGERLCEAAVKKEAGFAAFVIDKELVPMMESRSPRFVAGETFVRENTSSEFIARATAAVTVGTLAGRGQGDYDGQPVANVMEKLLRQQHLDERVAFCTAGALTLADLNTANTYFESDSARRLHESLPERKAHFSRMTQQLRRGIRNLPAATPEEIATGQKFASYLSRQGRMEVGFGMALLRVDKKRFFAACAHGMNSQDLDLDIDFGKSPAGRKILKLTKRLPVKKIVSSLKSADSQAAIGRAAEEMKRRHDQKTRDSFANLFNPMSFLNQLGAPRAACQAQASSSSSVCGSSAA